MGAQTPTPRTDLVKARFRSWEWKEVPPPPAIRMKRKMLDAPANFEAGKKYTLPREEAVGRWWTILNDNGKTPLVTAEFTPIETYMFQPKSQEPNKSIIRGCPGYPYEDGHIYWIPPESLNNPWWEPL